ncbi:MAG TPA: DUF6510 family protein [Acidimicrobiales bacterium]|nr:DUF6510 family protein [Acidimicrobiales bacterium]
MEPTALDGNASAGALSEVFAFDITTAATTCRSCGNVHMMSTLDAFLEGPGVVLRCASCEAVQLRFVRSDDNAWLDLGGVAVMQIPVVTT